MHVPSTLTRSLLSPLLFAPSLQAASAPPPYESVIGDTGGHQFFSASTHADAPFGGGGPSTLGPSSTPYPYSSSSPPAAVPPPRDLDITVGEPTKLGDGVGAYVTYKVRGARRWRVDSSR